MSGGGGEGGSEGDLGAVAVARAVELQWIGGGAVGGLAVDWSANFTGRNCKTFPSSFRRPTEFCFFQSGTESQKKHKLAYFIQLIAKWYKAYMQQKLETAKKVYIFCKHRP
jgi:hypothetical protein